MRPLKDTSSFFGPETLSILTQASNQAPKMKLGPTVLGPPQNCTARGEGEGKILPPLGPKSLHWGRWTFWNKKDIDSLDLLEFCKVEFGIETCIKKLQTKIQSHGGSGKPLCRKKHKYIRICRKNKGLHTFDEFLIDLLPEGCPIAPWSRPWGPAGTMGPMVLARTHGFCF